jgi:hypothetical protein
MSRRYSGAFAVGLFLCAVASALRSPVLIAAAATITAGAYLARDLLQFHRLTVMGAYAAGSGLSFGAANLLAYVLQGTRYDLIFDDYLISGEIVRAQLLAVLGVVVPLVVFDAARRVRVLQLSPNIGFSSSDGVIVAAGFSMAGLSWLNRIGPFPIASLGVAAAFVLQGPSIGVFMIRQRSLRSSRPPLPGWIAPVLVALTVGEVIFHFLFSLLRLEMVWPIVAYALPALTRPRRRHQILLVGCVLAFAFAFQPIGFARHSYGSDRLDAISSPQLSSAEEHVRAGPLGSVASLMARLSTHNQLSQVVFLAKRDGLVRGETLRYLQNVLVPRAVWKAKPTVAPGQYFAARIGRGRRTSSGGFSNAINMTVPGEFYLNFGWPGAFGGLMLMGLVYAILWTSLGGLRDPHNPVASAIGFLVISQAFFVGSNATAITSLFQLLVLGVVLGWCQALLPSRPDASVARPFAPWSGA